MNTLYSLAKRFIAQRDGSIATVFGLTFSMAVGASVGAVEIEKMQQTRKSMQAKLDSTILYLGTSEHKTDPQSAGEAFFLSTVADANVDVYGVDPTFEFDPETGNISGDVTFRRPMIFSGGMVPDATMSVSAIASPKITGKVEIAMVLDTSGSMQWSFASDWVNETYPNRRIDGLHEAASEMFDVIYENPQAIPAVAVIPYAASVDITDLFAGQAYNDRYSGFESLSGNSIDTVKMMHGLKASDINYGLSGPGPYAEANVLVERDRTHTMGIWPGERYMSQNADGSYNLSLDAPGANNANKMPIFTEDDSDLYCADWQIQSYGQRCTKWTYNYGWSQGGYMHPSNGVMPMTTDSQAVRNYVAGFSPNGGTAGHIAMAWGLYALSPDWNGVFSHPAGQPQQFNETTEKYLVFMTDGSFNSQKDPYMDDSEMYKYFQSVCDMANENGVRVFTVGLKLNATTDQYLENCVGQNGKHFPVDDKLELVGAFMSVGRETGELRLSH